MAWALFNETTVCAGTIIVIMKYCTFCSLSDSHASPRSSLATGHESRGGETSNTHAADSHVQTAVTGGQAKNRLAATFNLTADEDKHQSLLCNPHGSSSHKRQTHGSKKSHG